MDFTILAFVALIVFTVFVGIPTVAIYGSVFATLILVLVQGATLIARVFGLVDTAYPWAIPVALLSYAHEEPGLAMLFVGMVMIVLVRLFGVTLFGWVFSLIRGVNPFNPEGIPAQLLQLGAKKAFDMELKFKSEEDLRKVPPLRLLLIKVVLIGAAFTIAGELKLLVGMTLSPALQFLFAFLLLGLAIGVLVLSELPGLAGANYDPERKIKFLYKIEDKLNWLIGWIFLPTTLSLAALGVVVLIASEAGDVVSDQAGEVLGDNVYYDTFGERDKNGELVTRGFLLDQARTGFIDRLHPRKRAKLAMITPGAIAPAALTAKTAPPSTSHGLTAADFEKRRLDRLKRAGL